MPFECIFVLLGDVIVLGTSNVFRFNHPREAAELREKRKVKRKIFRETYMCLFQSWGISGKLLDSAQMLGKATRLVKLVDIWKSRRLMH